jgi:hypothetical protein
MDYPPLAAPFSSPELEEVLECNLLSLNPSSSEEEDDKLQECGVPFIFKGEVDLLSLFRTGCFFC